jgi:hypothetical protein
MLFRSGNSLKIIHSFSCHVTEQAAEENYQRKWERRRSIVNKGRCHLPGWKIPELLEEL